MKRNNRNRLKILIKIPVTKYVRSTFLNGKSVKLNPYFMEIPGFENKFLIYMEIPCYTLSTEKET